MSNPLTGAACSQLLGQPLEPSDAEPVLRTGVPLCGPGGDVFLAGSRSGLWRMFTGELEGGRSSSDSTWGSVSWIFTQELTSLLVESNFRSYCLKIIKKLRIKHG